MLEALYRAEVRGFSMSRVQGHGGELDRVETYRGTTVKMGLSEKVRFEIAVSDEFVEPTIDALCDGRRGPARSATARSSSSRSSGSSASARGETDNAAVTPVGGVMSRARPSVDAGDTAWMLAATALVLLMTPALGLFYAGLVRAKNTLNTFMMCVAALAVATVTWALVGYSLAFDDGNGLDRRPRVRVPARRRLRAARRDDDPAPALHGLPGDLLHHHHRAGVRRRRRADALRRVPRLRRAVVGARLRRARALGLRRRLAAGARARSTSPAACRSRWAPASRRSRPRSSWARARTTGARRSCRTTPSTCCSAPACCGSAGSASTAAAASRPGNAERARVHEHAARARVHARRLVRARPGPRRGRSRRSARRRRSSSAASGITPAARLHQPEAGRWRSARRRAAELRGDRLAAADARGRDARRARRPRHRGLHRASSSSASSRSSRGTASRTACSTATPRSSADQALAALAAPAYAFARHVRAAAS